jgi:hypothetical protein
MVAIVCVPNAVCKGALKPLQRRHRLVAVRASESERKSTDSPASSDLKVSNGTLDCVGEGQSVVCTVPEGESEAALTPADALQPADSPGKPVDLSFSDSTILPEALGWLLLISPFFFWGTAMVAMKVVAPHSTPLFTGVHASFLSLAAHCTHDAASGAVLHVGASWFLSAHHNCTKSSTKRGARDVQTHTALCSSVCAPSSSWVGSSCLGIIKREATSKHCSSLACLCCVRTR